MSATQVKLSLYSPGVFHTPGVNADAMAKASKVLQENHDNHHIFFNQSGFHSELAIFGFPVAVISNATCEIISPIICLHSTPSELLLAKYKDIMN